MKKECEVLGKVNFTIPFETVLKIDKHLYNLKTKGVVKSKRQLLSELVQLGIKEAMK